MVHTKRDLVSLPLFYHKSITLVTSKAGYLPEAPSPNTITLWLRDSTYGFGGDPVFSLQQSLTVSSCITYQIAKVKSKHRLKGLVDLKGLLKSENLDFW